MKHLSRGEIEEIARRLVTLYSHLPELKGKLFLRVDPELFIGRLLGLKIGYEHLSLDGNILGLTSYEEIGVGVYDENGREHIYYLDGKTVLVEKSLKEDQAQAGRCNFSLMHEGAHQIFKMLYPKYYGATAGDHAVLHPYKNGSEVKQPVCEWEEWQANVLASSMLLPPFVVEQGMYLFGLEQGIIRLDPVSDPVVYEKFENLALFLGCSKQVLAYRMRRLGQLQEDYLESKIIRVREKR